jgi:signal transduction histidine kinase
LPGDEFGEAVYYKSAGGEMFFGGVKGVTAFYPEKVADRPFVPPVVLTDFSLFNNPVPIGGKSPLKKSITYTDSLTLSHKQNIFTLEFSALSFASPARTRYRYLLEGLETQWNETTATHRLITYTTLPAAEYHFRVQSGDSSGGWSEPGLTLGIRVLPPLWNTWQFKTLCAVISLALLWLAYRFRARQMQHEFNVRLEGRVEERLRVARELHDTMLQTFQAALIQMQVACNLFSRRPEEAVKALQRAIDTSAEAIAEGREAIQQLRSSATLTNDIAGAIGGMGKELAAGETNTSAASFALQVEGQTRDVHAIVRDEICRVAFEAMRNAFRHAQAGRIEVDLWYDDRQLRLRVRDNGKGIDQKILEDGVAGHWGVHGMRERAKVIGGDLAVWSELNSGTEVELVVPAMIAYQTRSATRTSWFSRKKDP